MKKNRNNNNMKICILYSNIMRNLNSEIHTLQKALGLWFRQVAKLLEGKMFLSKDEFRNEELVRNN